MQFIYVLPGWEGSTSDSSFTKCYIKKERIKGSKRYHVVWVGLLHTLSIILLMYLGCYYLCGVGYTNSEGFLAPYGGQRHHLNEWMQGYQPRILPGCFNMKHSSARNVIERAFGLLKGR